MILSKAGRKAGKPSPGAAFPAFMRHRSDEPDDVGAVVARNRSRDAARASGGLAGSATANERRKKIPAAGPVCDRVAGKEPLERASPFSSFRPKKRDDPSRRRAPDSGDEKKKSSAPHRARCRSTSASTFARRPTRMRRRTTSSCAPRECTATRAEAWTRKTLGRSGRRTPPLRREYRANKKGAPRRALSFAAANRADQWSSLSISSA